MVPYRQIRADFDRHTFVVYQAFSPAIADRAIEARRFVPPFSFQRMTWIKPSFLWLMARSNWGQKPNQERTLAVRITRQGWEHALTQAVQTSFEARLHGTYAAWEERLELAPVRVQWDPERTLSGAKLPHRSIQVGLSRRIVQAYVEDWVVEITDLTARVTQIRKLLAEGRRDKARMLLPPERPFPVEGELAERIGAQ